MAALRLKLRRVGTLAWIFVAVVVTGLVTYAAADHHASEQARTNYENSLAGCFRANPKNEAYTLAVITAQEHATNPSAKEEFQRALRKIDNAPWTRANGTTECYRAVRAP